MNQSTLDHFKCNVRRFDTIDGEINQIVTQIKPLQTKLKVLKSSKKELQSTICEFMATNEIAECQLSNGALLYKESKNVIPLSKENIKQNIIKFFTENINNSEFNKQTPEEKGNIIFKYVYENREYRETNTLKKIL